jgi:hypothetical protein
MHLHHGDVSISYIGEILLEFEISFKEQLNGSNES